MTNDFGQRVYPLVRYVLDVLEQIRNSAKRKPSANDVAAKLRTMLSQFDVEGSRAKDFELAKRALVYWIDEVLVNSQWDQAAWWGDHTLERHFFDSRERAWRFFENAAAARQLENHDALETFYLCTCLGFQGIYRDRESLPKSDTAERGMGDTWNDLPVISDKTAAEPHVSEVEIKKAISMSWWDGDTDDLARKTWGLAGTAEEIEALIGGLNRSPNAPPPRKTSDSEAATLSEWVDSVYRQLATVSSGPYSPAGSPLEPGEAAPLTGRSSRGLAMLSLILAGIFLMTVAVMTLNRT